MERVARPLRYPRDKRLSSIVDQLLLIEEELAATDELNMTRILAARHLIEDVAMGVKRGE
jgi:hypothetical protein